MFSFSVFDYWIELNLFDLLAIGIALMTVADVFFELKKQRKKKWKIKK